MSRWRIIGHDPFARETYCSGEFDSEARARRAMNRLRRWLETYQDGAVRDWLWLEPPGEPAPSPDPPTTAARVLLQSAPANYGGRIGIIATY